MRINEIKNPLLKSFLADKKHYDLYQNYYQYPTEVTKEKLNSSYQKFHAKLRAISYFSKVIHYSARHIDKRTRTHENRYVLMLDGHKEDSGDELSLKDCLQDQHAQRKFEEHLNEKIEDFIEDKKLFHAISTLNERQKQILYLSYIMNFSDTEISKILNVTQQAISKSRVAALKKVRRLFSA